VKVILDTNVVISAFLWGGKPLQLLRMAADGTFDIFTSRILLEELERTLGYDKFFQHLMLAELNPMKARAKYESLTTIIDSPELPEIIVKKDPSDDAVIETAIAAEAEFIISGNDHLLELKQSYNFRIITPSEFIATISSM
jgi:putative PIN family toxin of toxin-antitoxin system